VSKYNYSQLALSLAEKDDKYLKYLKRTIKKKYSELDLKEFIAFYPDQFPVIQKAAEDEWKKYEDDFGDSMKAVSATVLADWLDGTVRTYVKDFLKGEWEMSEKVG